MGSKGGEGVYQRIISWIPPHDVYVEPFAGLAAVWRYKRPARRSILIDLDAAALDRIGDEAGCLDRIGDEAGCLDRIGDGRGDVETFVGDGVDYLRRMRPNGQRVFVYCDPPYLRETRRDPDRDYYLNDWSREDHEAFLPVVAGLGCPVLVSGYWSDLYAEALAGWAVERFPATTRAGPAEEVLWANYARPDSLHDYRFIGSTFPERWRIHKRQRNWVKALGRMAPVERRAMLSAIVEAYGADVGGELLGSTTSAVMATIDLLGGGGSRAL